MHRARAAAGHPRSAATGERENASKATAAEMAAIGPSGIEGLVDGLQIWARLSPRPEALGPHHRRGRARWSGRGVGAAGVRLSRQACKRAAALGASHLWRAAMPVKRRA